jgi:hypothetical protein
MSSVFFAHFITAPYAASKKQPIFSGGFLEWRLASLTYKVIQKQCVDIRQCAILKPKLFFNDNLTPEINKR